MKAFAIANQKGGVGKTTLARNMFFYAIEAGLRTLCVDLDPQRNFTKTLRTFRMRNGFDESEPNNILTASKLFIEPSGMVPLDCGSGAALVPADRDLLDVASLPLDSIRQPRSVLETIKRQFDVCIIDTAPTLGNPLYAALIAADFVVCPCTVDQDATDGLSDLFEDINRVQQMGWNSRLKPLGVLPNCVTKRAFDQQGLEALKTGLGSMLLPTTLYERAATKYAKERAVWQTSKGESNIQAAQEMKAACEYVFRKAGVIKGITK